MNLIKIILQKHANLLEFVVTDGWLFYLYQRVNFLWRVSTTSRHVVTEFLWIEICILFLFYICTYVSEYNISDELIINVYLTPSMYVATSGAASAGKTLNMFQNKVPKINM